MDFVSDSLLNGRRIKCLTVADDFSHECVNIAVDYPQRIPACCDQSLSDSTKWLYVLRGLRFHDVRHEAVTRLLEKGLNPMEASMVRGHKTLSMLQRSHT